MEIIDLQANDQIKNKYKEGNMVDFDKYLDAKEFPNLKQFACKFISMFGTAYQYVNKQFPGWSNWNQSTGRIYQMIIYNQIVLNFETLLHPNIYKNRPSFLPCIYFWFDR